MDREKESPPERLPFCLDDTVGEIVRASQECPGVYYIAARKQDGKFLADEYYVVEKSSPAISKEAMVYGRMALYMWPRSKVWMRAFKASIQTAATKVTNIGARLSSGASFCLRQIPI